MDTVHIACAADDRYAPHAAAMLRSALTETDREVAVHFLHGARLSASARDRLARMVERADGEIFFLEVPASEVAGLPTRRLADPLIGRFMRVGRLKKIREGGKSRW